MRLYNRINKKELKQKMLQSDEERTTISFYKYFYITNVQEFRDKLYLDLSNLGVLGRIYVANEGINAQVSLPSSNFQFFKDYLYSYPDFNGLRLNIAVEDDGKSFFKLDIKIKDRIVADGLPEGTYDISDVGTHLDAENFNKILEEKDIVLVDMRNHYESEIGHFDGAITPDVETFRESLPIIADDLEDKKDKKLVLYCTGGIRCEKASAYFKHKGFNDVYQLNGGIIQYAREVKAKGLENKFVGKNFVFDERLGERISEKIIAKCHQCGEPCDTHTNCANEACHILFIQCDKCKEKYHACCSDKCADFIQLPEEDQKIMRKMMEFNGTKFGKGRYKAHHKDNSLT